MSVVQLVGWSLVHSLWEGVVIGLLLVVVLRLVDQKHSTARYLLAATALFLAVVLPPITASRVAGDLPPTMESTAASFTTDPDPTPHRSAGLGAGYPASETVPGGELLQPEAGRDGSGATGPGISHRVQALFPWVVTVWIAGVLLLSLRLIGAYLRARRLRVEGTSAADPTLDRAFEHLVAKLGVLRPVRLLESSVLRVPAVIGWIRPVVLLPATLVTGLTIPQLEAVLAHELAHIRRHDYLVNLLQALVETLMFYHPVIWWISRQTRRERENCCDDVAVRACGDRRLYASALLTLEEHRALALMPAATGGDLLARIRRIAAPSLGHAEASPRWLAALIAVAAVLSLAGATAVITPGQGRLEAQDEPSGAAFSSRNVPVGPDTVIRHPDPAAPLADRWQWARQTAASERFTGFWVGYTIEPLPALDGRSIFIGRLERRGIGGSGGINLRGRITNFGDFTSFSVPGVRLAPLVGGGMPDDVALLFAFVLDGRNRPVLSRVHVSSLALPVDLEDRPLLWLGDSGDEESIAMVASLFDAASSELKPDVVAALGAHGSSSAVPYLARWLGGSEPGDVREEAAEWLGRHPDPGALALLSRAARNDRESDVRREAAEAIAEMTLPAATDSLIVLARELRDTDARQEAVEGLAEKSDPRALAAAADIARNDPNLDIRREAVETLGDFTGGAGFTELLRIVRSAQSRDVRMEAVETLTEAGEPAEVVKVLRQVIEEDPDEDVAREAVETLGEVADPEAVTVLRDLVRRHPRAEVRMEAIETLAELDQGGETVSLLSEVAREDQNAEVQGEALESLGEMGVPGARDLVAEVARSHANLEVRRRAVELIPQALEPLEALDKLRDIARHDPSEDVQREAAETMSELPPDLAIPALSDLARNHPSDEVRAEALDALGEIDSPAAIEAVIRVAESDAPREIRREAIETLGERHDRPAVLRVLAGIARADDDTELQREAVETIGENMGADGIAVLSEVARTHPNAEVRAEALETLTEMDAPAVLDILVAAANGDASAEVQDEAVEGLAELPDGAGVSALVRIAREHSRRDVRKKALEALSESEDPRAQAAIDRMLQQ